MIAHLASHNKNEVSDEVHTLFKDFNSLKAPKWAQFGKAGEKYCLQKIEMNILEKKKILPNAHNFKRTFDCAVLNSFEKIKN